ncbi:MAG: phage head-tail connector protein [Gemmataceae bacterium]
MPLTFETLSNLKQTLGIVDSGDDDMLEELGTRADDFIARYCGRSFGGGSFVEFFDGGARLLVLANYPVELGVEIRVDPGRFFTSESILPADRYIVRSDRGMISLASGGPFVPGASPYRYPQAVKVTYSTAESPIPPVVTQAYCELIGHWYRQTKTWMATNQTNVLSQSDGTSVTTYPWSQSGGFDIPRNVKKLLDPLRTPAV